ncbi:MAG: hypothetical protein AB7H97_13740, partial [Pseudobdellovibrionaceae bacterium]
YLSDKVIVQDVTDLAIQRQQENIKKFFEHVIKNPGKPYHQGIGTWGGPIGSLNINASRNLVSGTYYGSETGQVQLVDQVSVGATAGYFLGVDGIKNILPSISGNVQAIRSYTHVRPVLSISAADKESWKKLWVPGFMKQVSGILGTEGVVYNSPEEIEKLKEAHKKFLGELAEGEIFSITDTLAAGVQGTLTIPVTALMGVDIVFSNSFSLGVNTKAIMFRRVTFSRDQGQIKVYISSVKTGSIGASLDANFFMNIATLSRDFKKGQAVTRAYHMPEKYETDDELKNQVRAIQAVLMREDTSPVEDNFQPFILDHDMKSDVTKGKFLFWRWTWYEEKHRVKIQPPIPPDQNLDPREHERTLVSHRYLRRAGRNYYSFLSDVIDGVIGYSKLEWVKPGVLTTNSGDDPAASFLGSSKTYSITTEDEVTPGKDSAPVTISKTAWMGWVLSKERVLAVLDQIENRLNTLPVRGEITSSTVSTKGDASKTLRGNTFIIDRNVFNDMRQLQFYEISSSWIVRSEGLNKLVKFIMGNKGAKPGFNFGGKDAYTESDMIVITGLVNLMGGKEVFEKACLVQKLNKNPGTFPDNLAFGKTYDCLLKWQSQVLTFRRKYEKLDGEGRVEWLNELVKVLEENIPLKNLMDYLGAENFFFQVRVSGFRTGDESIDDKTFREESYVSSTIGTIGKGGSVGVFADFADQTKISQQEIYARYLGEGF